MTFVSDGFILFLGCTVIVFFVPTIQKSPTPGHVEQDPAEEKTLVLQTVSVIASNISHCVLSSMF